MKNSRLRPGTKVEGRPAAVISISASRVSAVSLMRPSSGSSSMWSAPSRLRPARDRCARKLLAQDRRARVELGRVALAVGKADGLDALIALERPGEADGRILPAGEQHQCRIVVMDAPSEAGAVELLDVERLEVDPVEAAHVEGHHTARRPARVPRANGWTPHVSQNW